MYNHHYCMPPEVRAAVENEILNTELCLQIIANKHSVPHQSVHSLGVRLLGRDMLKLRELRCRQLLQDKITALRQEGFPLEHICQQLQIKMSFAYKIKEELERNQSKVIESAPAPSEGAPAADGGDPDIHIVSTAETPAAERPELPPVKPAAALPSFAAQTKSTFAAGKERLPVTIKADGIELTYFPSVGTAEQSVAAVLKNLRA